MLNIKDIEFHYPNSDFKLKISSFNIKKGERVAVIGPSGSGKTTLLNLISGILVPQSGEIIFNELAINNEMESQRRKFRITEIGMVFQDFRLLEYLTAFENIIFLYRISPVLKIGDGIRDRAFALLREMGLEDQSYSYPAELSHGEKQRVAICRALLVQPSLILADEPTGNLDPENKEKINSIIFDQVKQNQTGLISVTHDYKNIDQFDRVIDFKDFLGGAG